MFNIFAPKNRGQQITLKVTGMHCSSCAMNIDGTLEDTAGVFRCQTSYARSTVTIDFDPQKINLRQISRIIQQVGYQVVELD